MGITLAIKTESEPPMLTLNPNTSSYDDVCVRLCSVAPSVRTTVRLDPPPAAVLPEIDVLETQTESSHAVPPISSPELLAREPSCAPLTVKPPPPAPQIFACDVVCTSSCRSYELAS
eukprot:3658353-Rhodomonas_salina.1